MHTRQRRDSQTLVLTLGDAVAAVSAVAADEREVVAIVLHMLRSRSLRLIGAARVIRSDAEPAERAR